MAVLWDVVDTFFYIMFLISIGLFFSMLASSEEARKDFIEFLLYKAMPGFFAGISLFYFAKFTTSILIISDTPELKDFLNYSLYNTSDLITATFFFMAFALISFVIRKLGAVTYD